MEDLYASNRNLFRRWGMLQCEKDLIFWIVLMIIALEVTLNAVAMIMLGSPLYTMFFWAFGGATFVTIFEKWIRI